MKRMLVCVLFFCCFLVGLKAFTLTGKVVDEETGIPVEYASVFYANTTIGTITNTNGCFSLTTSQNGVYDLVVSHLSYQTYVVNIPIDKDSIDILIKLKIKTYSIWPVDIIKNDPNRGIFLHVFETGVIGTSKNSLNCSLINPAALHFKKSYENEKTEEWILKADADSVLVIKNTALGYKLKYNLEYFLVHRRSNSIERIFYGYPLFEDEINSVEYPKRLSKIRKEAYEGSKLHFFRSLYSQNLKKDGFEVYKILEKPLRKEDPNEYGLLADSAFIGKSKVVLEQTENRLNLYNYLTQDSITGAVVLTIREPFEIRYVKRAEEEWYYHSDYFFTGLKVRLRSQSSIIRLRTGSIRFYQNGSYEKADELITIGYWSYKKLADALPFNYVYRK